jgi:hypothetical protein
MIHSALLLVEVHRWVSKSTLSCLGTTSITFNTLLTALKLGTFKHLYITYLPASDGTTSADYSYGQTSIWEQEYCCDIALNR